MKRLALIITIITAMALSACKSDSFKIEAQIEGMGTQNLMITYATEDGVVQDWATVQEDKLTYEGFAPEVTVITVAKEEGEMVLRTAVKNGDDISVKAVAGRPFDTTIDGAETAEEWNKFIMENRIEFEQGNNKAIDEAIEQFIANNPKNVLSTVLLLFEYSSLRNTAHIDSVLNTIDIAAKPLLLINTYNAVRNERNKVQDGNQIYMFNHYDSNGNWTEFRPIRHGYSVLWMWSNNDRQHKQQADSLKKIYDKLDGRLFVADVYTEADTLLWRKKFTADSTQWIHYWNPGGPYNPRTAYLRIFDTPTIMLIDSLGKCVYKGNAMGEIEKIIGKNDNMKSLLNMDKPIK